MAQRKKYFPVGTYGYRVQELMKSRGMNSADLYDVMMYDETIGGGTEDTQSKYAAVRYALGHPKYQHIQRLHDYFNVSADYLLGIDEGHAGLSEEAENYLQAMQSNHPLELKVLDLMLRDGSGLIELLSRIVDIERFCHRKAELETTLSVLTRKASDLIDNPPPWPEKDEPMTEETYLESIRMEAHIEECKKTENDITETEKQLKAIGSDTTYVAASYDAATLFSSMLRTIMPEDKYLRDPDAKPFVEDLKAEEFRIAASKEVSRK